MNRQGLAQKFLPVMEPVSFGRGEAEMFHDFARDLKAAPAAPAAAKA